MKTNEIMELANFVISHFPGLDHAGVEVHVKQYNGRGYLGVSFPTTERNRIRKRDQHYIKNIEPESKQYAIVYVRKNVKKWVAKVDVETWQEDFIATLTHELRHLWHWRKKKGLEEEDDCSRMEQVVIKKYRKVCNTSLKQCAKNSNTGPLAMTTQESEQ